MLSVPKYSDLTCAINTHSDRAMAVCSNKIKIISSLVNIMLIHLQTHIMCAFVSCWFSFEEELYAFKILGMKIKKGCSYNLSNALSKKAF